MTSKSIATLIDINIPGQVLRYQNYQTADYTFGGLLYSWAGFGVMTYSTNDLALSATDTVIALRNTSTIQNLLRQNNNFKRAPVTIYLVDPATGVTQAYRLVVSFATIEQGQVLFTLRSPTAALQGDLVTAKLDAQMFPAIPFYKPVL